MSGDPEFEDFLRRRRPLFRGDVDDGLEPPAELDRIVLRQAREAIKGDRPLRLLGMPRWAAPLAIAATLVIGLAVVFRAGTSPEQRVPQVRVESIAQRMDYPPARAEPPPAAPVPLPSEAPVMVTLDPPGTGVAPILRTDGNTAPQVVVNGSPPWRRDARSWQAEIDRLRARGDRGLADAEQAEFNRQFRALATAPDR